MTTPFAEGCTVTDDNPNSRVRTVLCPGCGEPVKPGQPVCHVDDPDPWRMLWHLDCAEERAAIGGTAIDPEPTP